MQQLLNTLTITKSAHERHVSNLTREQKLIVSHFKFDCSFVVVDSKNWVSYAPFLITSLGLTGEADKNKVMGMKFTDSDQWDTFDFMVEYDMGGTYTESFIKLFFLKEKFTRKYHLCFFRVKSEHTVKGSMRWCQEYFMDDGLLKASLEYRTTSEAIKQLSVL